MKYWKIFVLFCLMIVLLEFANLAYFLVAPAVFGASNDLRELQLQAPFSGLPSTMGGIEEGPCDTTEVSCPPGDKACEARNAKTCLKVPWLAMYIGAIYQYAVAIGSVIAVLFIMIGGVTYIYSGISPKKLDQAKKMMQGSVTGLILLVSSYLILYFVNPSLLNLKTLKIEVLKMQVSDVVNFCYELDTSKYTFYELSGNKVTTKMNCGQEYSYESNDPKVVHKGTCGGFMCSNSMETCLPCTSPKGYCVAGEVSPDKYKCGKARMWGLIKNYGDGRGVDYIKIFEFDDNSKTVGSKLASINTDESDTTAYAFTYENTGSWIGTSGKKLILEVEINDTGKAQMAEAYRPDSAVGEIASESTQGTFAKIIPSNDDTYYVMPDPSSKKENTVNVDGKTISFLTYTNSLWYEPCKGGNCMVGIFKGPDPWDFTIGAYEGEPFNGKCEYIESYYTMDGQGGVRLDIDVQDFWEDRDLDCSTVEQANKLNAMGSKKVGESCANKSDCESGDCETENGTKKCECNSNTDCPANSYCHTSWATFNDCLKTFPLGHSCNSSAECSSEQCQFSNGTNNPGVCICDEDKDCRNSLPGGYKMPSWFQKANADKFEAKCSETDKTTCTACVPNDPVDWDGFAKGKPEDAQEQAPYNVCINNADCCSGHCNSKGYCQCKSDAECPYSNQFCNKDGFCEKNRKNLAECTLYSDTYKVNECGKNAECITAGWYDLDGDWIETRCSCNNNAGCEGNTRCIDVENNCGWNYCLSNTALIPIVENNYSPVADYNSSKLSSSQLYWGLCDKDENCAPGQYNHPLCQTDHGYNSCAACMEMAPDAEQSI